MKQLNPNWLRAAVLKNSNSEKVGTVVSVSNDNDTITVMCKGKQVFMSAASVQDRLFKPNAIHAKYI